METRDKAPDATRPMGGARAYRSPAEREVARAPEGERGMSSVAMRARKGKQKQKRGPAPTERKPRVRESAAARVEKVEKADEGEQPIRKGIYLSALIFVEGDWPVARDFAGPATAAVKEALGRAFEGEHNGLTLRLKGLAVRTDVEEDDEDESESEGKKEEKFEF